MNRNRMLMAAVVIFTAWRSAAIPPAEPVRQRTRWTGDWRFHLGDITQGQAPALDDANWRILDLPHDWSAEADFRPDFASGTGFLPGGTGWYRKTFTLPDTMRGRRFLVEFDGVYRNSEVWINGHALGTRPYGYSSFHYDLTPHLQFDGRPNVLAVRVARAEVADSRWYPGTGIYRNVWLTETDPLHIAPWGVFVRTPRITAEAADVACSVEVVNGRVGGASVRVTAVVINPEGETAAETARGGTIEAGGAHTFSLWQKVMAPRLWSPDTPALYTLVVRIATGGDTVDEMRVPFGIRSARFDPDRGFYLNGEHLPIKGLCLHHDGGVVGAAVPEGVLERRLRLVKSLGANAVRCAHNPMAPEFYDLCDRLGLLVMDEAFDEWELGKRKWVEGRNAGTAERFGYSEDFETWAERDCADMVRRGRNHPSIILWSLGNEIDYPTDPYVHPESRLDAAFENDLRQPTATRLTVVAPQLIAAAKRHDPTRPVTMALANLPASNGTGLAAMLDVVGYNYQEQYYDEDHRLFPGRAMLGSENGKGFEQWKAVLDRPFVGGQFLWAGFDFLGEADRWPNHGSRAGLFDTCGFPKVFAEHRRALWSDQPMVFAAVYAEGEAADGGRRRRSPRAHWNWETGAGPVRVVVFSNCTEVELRLNGRAVGRAPTDEARTASWTLPFEPGVLSVIGLRDGRPAAAHELRTAGEPVRLALTADRDALQANSVDVAHIEVTAVDANGAPVYDAEIPVTVRIEGTGRLLGLDNGELTDPTPLRSPTKNLNHGRALAIVQAGRSAGPLMLKAVAESLEPAAVILRVE